MLKLIDSQCIKLTWSRILLQWVQTSCSCNVSKQIWFIPCEAFNFLFGNRWAKSTINVPTIAFKNTKQCAHWGCGDIQAVLPQRATSGSKALLQRSLCWCLWSKSPPTVMRMSVAWVAAWNHLDTHELCCCQVPYWSERPMLPPEAMMMSGPTVLLQQGTVSVAWAAVTRNQVKAHDCEEQGDYFAVISMTADTQLRGRTMEGFCDKPCPTNTLQK